MRHTYSRRTLLATLGAFPIAACTVDGTQNEVMPNVKAESGKWMKGPGLPFAVQEIYPCLHDNAIHLAGGFVAENGRISGPTNAYFDLAINPFDPTNADLEESKWLATDWRTLSERNANKSTLPVPRHHPHLVSFKGKLLAFAGFESASENAAWIMQKSGWVFERFEARYGGPFHKATGPCPELPAPCAEAVVGVTGDGLLHLAGGRTPIGSANATWRDQGDTDHHFVLVDLDSAWERAAPCLSKRNSAAGDVIDGDLHVVGGRQVGGGNVATHEVYDPKEDRWRTAAPMPQAQGGLAAAALGGKLYVFGGEYFENGGGVYPESWVYDPSTDAWAALPDMPTPRHGLGAVAMNNAIYVIGGAAKAGGVETSAAVEIFVP